jgi:polysaccharide biosynthesis transport protein
METTRTPAGFEVNAVWRVNKEQFMSTDDLDGLADKGGLDPLGILLRHKLLIVFAGLLGVGLGYLHYARQPRVYESAATLLIVEEKRDDLPIKGLESMRTKDDNLATQMYLIRSPLVVDKAAVDPEIQSVPEIAGSDDPAGVIMAGLALGQAKASNGTYAPDILELRFRGASPENCPKVLNAVIAAYQEFLDGTRTEISGETEALITNAQTTLMKTLETKESELRELRQNSDLIWEGDVGTNIHQQRLKEIERSRAEIIISSTELKSQIEALEQAERQGLPREALIQMAGHIATSQFRGSLTDPAQIASLKTQLAELEIEEQVARAKYGAKHPKLITLQGRLEILRGMMAANPKSSEPEAPDQSSQDFFKQYVDSLHQEYAVLLKQKEDLNVLYEEEFKLAKELNEAETKSATLLADITRTQQLFDGVVKRLDEISLIKDVKGTFTQVVNQPSIGVQVLPRLTTTLSIAALVGLALGFGFAGTLELTNRDFRSLDDLARQLRVPVVGQYPEQKKPMVELGDSPLHASLVAYHQPKSRLAEAYRGVRTSLYFSQRNDDQSHRVLQITSPLAGDGKTTLTSNLAITIAQSGKTVLLIEADLRRPRAARLFGLEKEDGLANVLNGESEIADCVHPSGILNLMVLPAGNRPFNPSELLSTAEFRQLLEVMRGKFDYVLIDSPPLLPVTDASVIAAAVDGVLLLLRSRKHLRQAAMASVEKLQAVQATLLGVVIHGDIQQQSYGYGYGYSYGYGYGYGQGYDQEYSDGEEEDGQSPPNDRLIGVAAASRSPA